MNKIVPQDVVEQPSHDTHVMVNIGAGERYADAFRKHMFMRSHMVPCIGYI